MIEDEDERYAAQRERGPRDSMFLQAALRREDGSVATVRVRNISDGGVLVETPIPMKQGEAIAVDLRNIGFVPGRIVWTGGGKCGVAFDGQIDARLTRQPLKAKNEPAMGPTVVLVRRPGLRFS